MIKDEMAAGQIHEQLVHSYDPTLMSLPEYLLIRKEPKDVLLLKSSCGTTPYCSFHPSPCLHKELLRNCKHRCALFLFAPLTLCPPWLSISDLKWGGCEGSGASGTNASTCSVRHVPLARLDEQEALSFESDGLQSTKTLLYVCSGGFLVIWAKI